MATTPRGYPYPLPTAPVAEGANDIRALAEAIDTKAGFYAAAPPAAPKDGDIWVLPVAAGIAWQFRYNAAAAGAFKWEFIGGPSLVNYVPAVEGRPTGGFGDLTTVGPRLQAPRAGEYQIDTYAQIVIGPTATGAATFTFLMQLLAETSAVVVGTPWEWTGLSSTLTKFSERMGMESVPVTLQANEFVKVQYAQTLGPTFQQWGTRRMLMRPIRIS